MSGRVLGLGFRVSKKKGCGVSGLRKLLRPNLQRQSINSFELIACLYPTPDTPTPDTLHPTPNNPSPEFLKEVSFLAVPFHFSRFPQPPRWNSGLRTFSLSRVEKPAAVFPVRQIETLVRTAAQAGAVGLAVPRKRAAHVSVPAAKQRCQQADKPLDDAKRFSGSVVNKYFFCGSHLFTPRMRGKLNKSHPQTNAQRNRKNNHSTKVLVVVGGAGVPFARSALSQFSEVNRF